MKFLIIEDERRAADRLQRMIEQVSQDHRVVSRLESVRESLEYFESPDELDLIFSDIHLADGLCFEIFEQREIRVPVIFTTSYDQYALRAFKNNGIDYLLKPISEEELSSSIDKALELGVGSNRKFKELASLIRTPQRDFKSRFLIRHGEKLTSVPVAEVSCFFSMQKSTFIQLPSGRTFDLDYSLDQLERMLDPSSFHRVNRKQIVHIDFVGEMVAYSNSRLRLNVAGVEEEVIVARERVSGFKSWMDR